ncbi:MAG: hypothetical protein IKE56_08620 [Lachnospiraceae bacterium]|jgi:hypothetical protein|nr:hypothetical protein [Lachnospiraceae bacterium]MBR2532702.1 hypothetical protein [Lachnospiraceae bacterium]
MSKKSAGGLLGTLLVAGVAAGIVKYLKDYSGASFTDEEQIKKVKKNSGEVKDAARRTYVAIKEKGNIKEAAEELAKAAGSVVSDSAEIAKTAGAGAMKAAKDIKAKFDEDPEAAKEEVISNLKEMGSDISHKVTETAEEVVERFRGEDEFTDFEDSDFDDVVEGAEGIAEEAREAAADAAEKAADCACQTAEDVIKAAEEAADAVKDGAADAAAYVADKAEEEAIETADLLDELGDAAEEQIAEAAEEAAKVLNGTPSVTITDDEID